MIGGLKGKRDKEEEEEKKRNIYSLVRERRQVVRMSTARELIDGHACRQANQLFLRERVSQAIDLLGVVHNDVYACSMAEEKRRGEKLTKCLDANICSFEILFMSIITVDMPEDIDIMKIRIGVHE